MNKQILFSTRGLDTKVCPFCHRPIRTCQMVRIGGEFYHKGCVKFMLSNHKQVTKKKAKKVNWFVAKLLASLGIIYALSLILFLPR